MHLRHSRSIEVYQHDSLFSQRRQIQPASLGPALHAEFGELHALSSLKQRPWEGCVRDHMFEEELPLNFEGVVKDPIGRHDLPGLEEVDGAGDVGVPDRHGRKGILLHHTLAQTGHRAALCPVHLQRQQIIPTHAHGP